jgi:hypothetical protein
LQVIYLRELLGLQWAVAGEEKGDAFEPNQPVLGGVLR